MNLSEAAELLATVQSFDKRTVGQVDAAAWHAALGDLPLDLCRQAVVKHYSHETSWLMPAHVRKLVNSDRTGDGPLALPEHDSGLRPMPAWFRVKVEQMWRKP